jgi:sugar phosphate isomerase/epimerase
MPIVDRPSVQLYTLRSSLAEDISGTIQRLADIGYEQVEPFGLVEYAEGLASAFAETGVTAPTAHAALVGQDVDAVFDAAGRLGVRTVIAPSVDPARWNGRDSVAAVAEDLNRIADRAATFGLRIGYHNHAFELSSRVDGVAALEVFADHLSPEVLLEVDTYWAAVGGEDPVGVVSRLGDRVRFLHLKDGPISDVNRDQVAVGAGVMPVADIVAAASALEVGVVELDDTAGDVWDAVAESLRFLSLDATATTESGRS